MLLANAAAFELDYNAKRLPFTCDSAQRITVPVLLLSGDRSPAGLQRITEIMARCIKGARPAKIPQATHWLPHDQPKAFNEAVLTFLKRNNQ
jgi:pimeloyl-ACP methyl ester carboxylesterase